MHSQIRKANHTGLWYFLKRSGALIASTWEIYLLLALSVTSIVDDYVHFSETLTGHNAIGRFQVTLTYMILMLSLLSIHLIRRDAARINADLIPSFEHLPLDEALRAARGTQTYFERIRILAATTANIQPMLMMNTDIVIQQCNLIVSQSDNPNDPHSIRVKFFMNYWIDCFTQKRIHNLSIKGYEFVPLLYLVILDSRSMVFGLFKEDNTLQIKIDVGQPIVITGDTHDGSLLITKWTDWFDSLEGRLPVHRDFVIPQPTSTSTALTQQ